MDAVLICPSWMCAVYYNQYALAKKQTQHNRNTPTASFSAEQPQLLFTQSTDEPNSSPGVAVCNNQTNAATQAAAQEVGSISRRIVTDRLRIQVSAAYVRPERSRIAHTAFYRKAERSEPPAGRRIKSHWHCRC